MIIVKTYKIFSSLLVYPSKEVKDNVDLFFSILKDDKLLPDFILSSLSVFFSYFKETDLIVLQENYVSMFDRKKDLSLYLFEHIHGDSKERGMAMVDLKNLYRSSDLDLDVNGELPDYIPVFLEYLSTLSVEKSSILLGEIINILVIIRKRLELYESLYYLIFSSLEYLSNVKPDNDLIKAVFSNKKIDLNIDKEWEDPKVF